MNKYTITKTAKQLPLEDSILMTVNDESKYVCVWLKKGDMEIPEIREQLDSVYKESGAKKYKVVVFESGRSDLYDVTETLVVKNFTRECGDNDLTR